MAILIRNAYVFAPKELGVTDVLIVGEKILAVAPNLSASLPGLSIIDATGFILAPGFVDAHVHVLGGGGVNGPDTRAPAISAGELIRAGITTVVGVLGADVMTRKLPDLLAKVRELNEDDDVDGFIVQLPLPKHISEQKVIETIDYRKDVDGFHPINVGRMSIGLPCYVSATPNGILELLKRYRIETSGKKCVVLGRSNIVGKPMAALMMQKAYPGDATVTVCHSRSKDLVKECREADIIIAALGQPNFVKAEMVKEGAVVIDVGTTRVPDASKKSGFKLTGDVKFDEVSPKCSFITPVPGGVGPMTIVSLMKNTLLAGKKAIYQ